MKINQLFKSVVTDELMLNVLACFGLRDLNDDHWFCKEDLESLQTVEKMRMYIDPLSQYYLPCKGRLYLADLNDSKCITVLRQLLRVHGRVLLSKQKYVQQKKTTIYSIRREASEKRTALKIDPDHKTVLTFL